MPKSMSIEHRRDYLVPSVRLISTDILEFQFQTLQEVSSSLSSLRGSSASLFLRQLAYLQVTTSFNVTAGYTPFLDF